MRIIYWLLLILLSSTGVDTVQTVDLVVMQTTRRPDLAFHFLPLPTHKLDISVIDS
jgi:hypothetical protein